MNDLIQALEKIHGLNNDCKLRFGGMRTFVSDWDQRLAYEKLLNQIDDICYFAIKKGKEHETKLKAN